MYYLPLNPDSICNELCRSITKFQPRSDYINIVGSYQYFVYFSIAISLLALKYSLNIFIGKNLF